MFRAETSNHLLNTIYISSFFLVDGVQISGVVFSWTQHNKIEPLTYLQLLIALGINYYKTTKIWVVRGTCQS